jgi:hypothetical protein
MASDFDQIYAIGQQVGVAVLGLGVIVESIRRKIKSSKKEDAEEGAPDTGPIRLPSDALTNTHPDPVVRRLERMLDGMGKQLDEQQRRIDSADKREGAMRQDLEVLRVEAQTNGDQVYWLRRIVRRLIEAWPTDHSTPPPLSAHEWEIVGVDEDTTPRPFPFDDQG